MDVLGGCSKEVEQNIKELVGDKCESIMHQMQKAILSSSLHIARKFKMKSQISIRILDTFFNRCLILNIIEILLTYLRRSHGSMEKLNRKIPKISHSMYKPLQIKAGPQNCNAKIPPLNRPSGNKHPGELVLGICPRIQSKTKQKR